MDYRGLNAVTKADTFSLPCIDDLFDQLGKAKYFSTLDLASGFWQIRMEPFSWIILNPQKSQHVSITLSNRHHEKGVYNKGYIVELESEEDV